VAEGSAKLMDARVILVDDDAETVIVARERLEPHLGPVVTFSDPAAALRHLESGEHYEALVAAVNTKPVSGLDLLLRARQTNPMLEVLFLADRNSFDLALKGVQLGAVDFVTKPVSDWDAVGRSVRRALGERDLKIERARLTQELIMRNDELRRAVDLLRKSQDIAEAMHASRDVRDVLNILLTTATEILQAERVSIMIRDPNSDEMAIRVAAGVSKAVIEHERVKPGEGVAGRVIAEGKALVVNDALADERVPQDQSKQKRYRGRAFMCIPITLLGSSRVMGVVNVTERASDRPFTDVEAEFITHLGRQAAHALMTAALLKTHEKK
jgi:FixJ family two-component response regulator